MPGDDNTTVDLRDEVQFLRELVERLVGELVIARGLGLNVVIPPIIIERPVPIMPRRSSPWFQAPWYTTWISPNTIDCGSNTVTTGGPTAIIQWNVTSGEDESGAMVPR